MGPRGPVPVTEKAAEFVKSEHEKILEWRRDVFRELFPGAPADDIETLARSKADLHEADKLSKGGCNFDTAFKILA
jgi:hypothetical protein